MTETTMDQAVDLQADPRVDRLVVQAMGRSVVQAAIRLAVLAAAQQVDLPAAPHLLRRRYSAASGLVAQSVQETLAIASSLVE